jgi:hypothetical protein
LLVGYLNNLKTKIPKAMKLPYFPLLALFLLVFATAQSQQNRDDINGDWSAQNVVLYDTPEAAVMVRVGDIDNLGFGWPGGFDPFTGASTPAHAYPFDPSPTDHDGTDRIMVVTSYDGSPPASQDGYTSNTSRPENLPRPILMTYSLNSVQVNSAVLQIFVDDFQAPVFQANYTVTINGEPAPYFASQINTLVQTGPIGKLITVAIPQSQLSLVADGFLSILIDDLTTGAGDGYAIDFVKLLVNPTNFSYTGTISGMVTDQDGGGAIEGAMVNASGLIETTSDAEGNYTLLNVPAGYVSITASASGYETFNGLVDLQDGQTATYNIQLIKAQVPECDTLHYPFQGSSVLFTVTPPESGFVCGNNSYGDIVKAEFFQPEEPNKRVYAALFDFGFISVASGQNPLVDFKIWDDQGSGGYPGNVLGTASIPINQIFDDVVAGNTTRVDFDPPVDISGDFYIGLELPDTPGDTLALISSDVDEIVPGRAFEQWSDSSWHAFNEPNNWNINLSMAIFALYCDVGFGIDEELTDAEVKLYPNPASEVLYIDFDNIQSNSTKVISIFNTLGVMVKSLEFPAIKHVLEVPLDDISPGIYLVRLSSDNYRATKKIVIK